MGRRAEPVPAKVGCTLAVLPLTLDCPVTMTCAPPDAWMPPPSCHALTEIQGVGVHEARERRAVATCGGASMPHERAASMGGMEQLRPMGVGRTLPAVLPCTLEWSEMVTAAPACARRSAERRLGRTSSTFLWAVDFCMPLGMIGCGGWRFFTGT